MTVDIEKLEALAKAAQASEVADISAHEYHDAQCAYERAANPAAVLELTQTIRDLQSSIQGLKTGYEAYERVNAELRAECEKLRAYGEEFASLAERRREQVEALRVSLRAFTGACYPVSKSIDERGYVWSESYLDQALEMSKEQSHD